MQRSYLKRLKSATETKDPHQPQSLFSSMGLLYFLAFTVTGITNVSQFYSLKKKRLLSKHYGHGKNVGEYYVRDYVLILYDYLMLFGRYLSADLVQYFTEISL